MGFKPIEGARTSILTGIDTNDNTAVVALAKTVECTRNTCPGVVGVACSVTPAVHIERATALMQSGTPEDRRVLKAVFRRTEAIVTTRR